MLNILCNRTTVTRRHCLRWQRLRPPFTPIATGFGLSPQRFVKGDLMPAAANKTKVYARLRNHTLAEAIRKVHKLPQDSPIRKRLRDRGFSVTMNGIVPWLFDRERCDMLIDEVFGAP